MAKSQRNKTIDLTDGQVKEYLARCVTTLTPEIQPSAVIYGDVIKACKAIAPKSVDLMIADPPYNLSKSFNGNDFKKRTEEDYEAYTRAWIEASLPLLKPTASVYVCCDWQSGIIIGRVLQDYFTVRNRITWQREKGRGAAKNWKNGMEDVWFVTNGNDYTFNLDAVKVKKRVLAPYPEEGEPKDWFVEGGGKYRYTCPSNFWDDLTVPYWSMSENTVHPTQKPEKLIAKLILASSNENDLVFDPFLGSGTTAVTAKKLSRRFLGIEREAKYCAISQYRLEKAEENPTIQGFENGVFLDRNEKPKGKKD